MTVHSGSRNLIAPDRVAALRDLGLDHSPDPEMERFARRVRDQLVVPTALVSLVQADQQVFPGACGLPPPWDERRSTPLSHSLCQYVIETGERLVISDARSEPLVSDNLAVSQLGVVAYAGFPLADEDGHVLGCLCAIDGVVRAWTDEQLRALEDLARDCRTALRLRLSRLDASRERERRDRVEAQLQAEIGRSRRMLSIAESLNEARTVEGIAGRLTHELAAIPGFRSVRLHLAEVLDREPPPVSATVLECARARGIVELGATTCAPVVGTSGLLGVLELRWQGTPSPGEVDHAGVSALGSHVAHALERAQLIERRVGVAHQLQAAMLTTLPEVPGLRLAACYVPAGAEEWVGGDWYDAIVLPPTDSAVDVAVAVTVGDVIGHDIPAAAVMGQARAMLRQAAFDRPGGGPADVFTHFELACAALGVEANGSAVLAFLERSRRTGSWRMTWTSAGHPPPLLAADGTVRRLELAPDEQGLLFGYRDVFDGERTDAHVDLPPGSTVLFYSDGVIEVPGLNLDEQIDELGDMLLEQHGRGPQAVVDAVSMQFGSGHDDVVALAVRVPDEAATPPAPAASSPRARATPPSTPGTPAPRPRRAPG
jgi:GAF domain-containing protein